MKKLAFLFFFLFDAHLAFGLEKDFVTVSLDHQNAVYELNEKALITVRKLKQPSDHRFYLNIEGQFLSGDVGNSIAFKSDRDVLLFETPALGLGQDYSIQIRAYLESVNVKEVRKKLDLIQKQIDEIARLIDQTPTYELIKQREALLSLKASLQKEIEDERTLVFSKKIDLAVQDSEKPSIGTISFSGVNAAGFNGDVSSFKAVIQGTTFANEKEKMDISNQDEFVYPETFSMDSQNIYLQGIVKNGRNDVTVRAEDVNGAIAEGHVTFWYGSRTTSVFVLDPTGQPVVGALVRAQLGVNSEIFEEQISSETGQVIFHDLPEEDIFYSTAKGNALGILTVPGTVEQAYLLLKPFSEPTDPNLDFARGLDGWDTSSGMVTRVEHQGDGEFSPSPQLRPSKNRILYDSENKKLMSGREECHSTGCDLEIRTSGEGAKSTSHSFIAGFANLKIKYKFITDEIPGGFYDSPYDDCFDIVVATPSGNQKIHESMHSLGLSAFNATGSTKWLEASFIVPLGQFVEIRASVTNVADGWVDSRLVISIEENPFSITGADLQDVLHKSIDYLSVGPSPYFGGKTILNGVASLKGPPGSRLTNIGLEFIGPQHIIASLVSPTSFANLIFDSNGMLTLPMTFSFSGTNTQSSNLGYQAILNAEILGPDFTPYKAAFQMKKTFLPLISMATDGRRYGKTRDLELGGDDWVRPETKDRVEQVLSSGTKFNDLAKMNGGEFAPHTSHGNGINGDFQTSKYLTLMQTKSAEDLVAHAAQRKAAAQELISIIHANANNIQVVGVNDEFSSSPQDAFWIEIKNDSIAKKLCEPWRDHRDHFHIRFKK